VAVPVVLDFFHILNMLNRVDLVVEWGLQLEQELVMLEEMNLEQIQ
jgi:hypothetical protein